MASLIGWLARAIDLSGGHPLPWRRFDRNDRLPHHWRIRKPTTYAHQISHNIEYKIIIYRFLSVSGCFYPQSVGPLHCYY
jgi:hypothetical protein